MSKELLRTLPAVDKLLATPAARRLIEASNRDLVRQLLRDILDEMRREVISGQMSTSSAANGAKPDSEVRHGENGLQTAEDLEKEIEDRLIRRTEQLLKPSLGRLVNATGVVLHTNLGRAPLAREAVEAVAQTAAHYSNLEYDLGAGQRGKREAHCRDLLARLTGAEDAVVANNGAAAVMLVLNTLAEGGEVIVSRGELIEIGGSFRIPDVMEKSGARLREVGTTNRTRITDYENAINENSRLLLRVHPSNYRIIGFTERPSVEELVALSARAGIPAFEDLGSGCLLDLAPYGIKDEPVVGASLAAGMSVVTFSGDKMLGGPQAGIIAGKREIIERIRKNPLLRALRVDKMTYAALESTLRLYERGVAASHVPVIRALAMTRDEVEERAVAFKRRAEAATNGEFEFSLEDGASVVGGGAAPEVKIPTVLVALRSSQLSASAIEERLRHHATPIIARTERDRVLLDLRTVAEEEEGIILEAIFQKGAVAQPAAPNAASVEV